MSKLAAILILSMVFLTGCPNDIGDPIATSDSGEAPLDTPMGPADSGVLGCNIRSGLPCRRDGLAPNCCFVGTECQAQPLWLGTGATCCTTTLGATCERKADCCGFVECVNGRCVNPSAENSCDPVATSQNGCPPDATLCLLTDAMPVPNCIGAVGSVPVGDACQAGNVCVPGSYCSRQESRCRAYCNFDSPACPAGMRCSRIAMTRYGACVPM